MIKPEIFFRYLVDNDVNFFCGVPDSLLKNFCAYISDNVSPMNNIITANEGGAIALAAGYHLSTSKVPLVYMQNSGIGNSINPLLSLVDTKVYSIPMLLMIGWRGEPSTKDEPQHIKQGEVTVELLKSLGINYSIIPNDAKDVLDIINYSIEYVKGCNAPFAYVVRNNTFDDYKLKSIAITNFVMNREDAIKIIVDYLGKNDIVVSTTGKTSRELFEYREKLGQSHSNDFLTVGSMGHASQIALGIAMQKPNLRVYCFDGDGSIIMHTGSLGIIGFIAPRNLIHIVFNNGAHDSVGGQPTIGFNIDFSRLAKEFGYNNSFIVDYPDDLKEIIKTIGNLEGPSLLEIRINKGSRNNLSRPTIRPIDNKMSFMNKIGT